MGLKRLLLAENIVINGDFSDGSNGWNSLYAYLSVYPKTLRVTASGGSALARFGRQIGTWALGKKVYAKFRVRVTNSNCNKMYLQLKNTGITGVNRASFQVDNPISNQWYPFSVLGTGDGTSAMWLAGIHEYADAATANGKVMEVQEVLAIDLPALFGLGNEPQIEFCDAMFANWFDGSRVIAPVISRRPSLLRQA